MSRPGDRSEREADNIASRALSGAGGAVACASTERAPEHVDLELSAAIAEQVEGGGRSLDVATRQHMESRFDTSFADVRVHTGPRAGALTRELKTEVFTFGQDIFASSAAANLHARPKLLGHELAHVIQQRRAGGEARIQRAPPATREDEPERTIPGPAIPQGPPGVVPGGMVGATPPIDIDPTRPQRGCQVSCCEKDDLQTLRVAQAGALKKLDQAWQLLGAFDKHARKQFRDYIGPSRDDEMREQARTTITEVRDRMRNLDLSDGAQTNEDSPERCVGDDSVHVKCESKACEADRRMTAYWQAGTGELVFRRLFFDKGVREREAFFIHEMVHVNNSLTGAELPMSDDIDVYVHNPLFRYLTHHRGTERTRQYTAYNPDSISRLVMGVSNPEHHDLESPEEADAGPSGLGAPSEKPDVQIGFGLTRRRSRKAMGLAILAADAAAAQSRSDDSGYFHAVFDDLHTSLSNLYNIKAGKRRKRPGIVNDRGLTTLYVPQTFALRTLNRQIFEILVAGLEASNPLVPDLCRDYVGYAMKALDGSYLPGVLRSKPKQSYGDACG